MKGKIIWVARGVNFISMGRTKEEALGNPGYMSYRTFNIWYGMKLDKGQQKKIRVTEIK